MPRLLMTALIKTGEFLIKCANLTLKTFHFSVCNIDQSLCCVSTSAFYIRFQVHVIEFCFCFFLINCNSKQITCWRKSNSFKLSLIWKGNVGNILLTVLLLSLSLSNVVEYLTNCVSGSSVTNLSLSILQGNPRLVAASIDLHHSLTGM